MRGLLVSIPIWLVVTAILDLVGDVTLSTTAFFVGGSLVTVLGLLLITWDRPPGIAIRLRILYSSIILLSLGATLFVYSYIAVNTSIPFYLALTLLILGTGEVFVGIKRTPKELSGYSINRLRLWGALIGMGFSLGIASTLLTVWGNQVFNWSILIVLSFGLGVGSLLGLWLELKKPKR